VVVKLYFGTAGWKATKEHSIGRALFDSSTLRAAQVLGCGRLELHDAHSLITSDLGDLSLWRAIDIGIYSLREGLRVVGQLLSEFHSLALGLPATAANGDWQDTVTLDSLTRRQLSLLEHSQSAGLARQAQPALRRAVLLSQEVTDPVWCHGDLHPANVIMYSTSRSPLLPYLIDFESSTLGPPEHDLAKSVVTSSAFAGSTRDELIAGYGQERRISEELVNALIVFHTIDGWLYAAQRERRDRTLWRDRMELVMSNYASQF
jgi:aminoglycoside phosphotransferase (APT) family kinase protein